MQHLDEGTIHAWLDDQLPPDEARSVEAHVAECRPCADAVAEARGLIAASSRILAALDNVPRGVVPGSEPHRDDRSESGSGSATGSVTVIDGASRAAAPHAPSQAGRRAWRRWFNGPSLAAAATIVVAAGTFSIWRARGDAARPSMAPVAKVSADVASPAGPSVDSNATAVASASSVPAAPPPEAFVAGQPDASPARTLGAATRTGNEARETASGARRAVAQLAREADQGAAGNSQTRDSSLAKDARALADAAASGRAASVAEQIRVDRPTVADERKAEERMKVRLEVPKQVAAVPIPAADPVMATPTSNVIAATGAVRGRVTDANNTALTGAMVSVPGTRLGVPTNEAGEFALDGVPPGPQRLTVRRIGYEPAIRTFTASAGQTSTIDIVMRPAQTSLEGVVVTSAPGGTPVTLAPRAREGRAAAASVDAARGAPNTAAQSTAVGCYELGITPTSPQVRTRFDQVPRRVALDSAIVPANADGIWYRARDLATTRPVADGLWRPAGPEGVEMEWTVGSRTSRVRLSGQPGSLMRGTVEEIDRAAGTGEAGSVVAVRRSCGG